MLLLSPRGYLLSFPALKTPERYATREKKTKFLEAKQSKEANDLRSSLRGPIEVKGGREKCSVKQDRPLLENIVNAGGLSNGTKTFWAWSTLFFSVVSRSVRNDADVI